MVVIESYDKIIYMKNKKLVILFIILALVLVGGVIFVSLKNFNLKKDETSKITTSYLMRDSEPYYKDDYPGIIFRLIESNDGIEKIYAREINKTSDYLTDNIRVFYREFSDGKELRYSILKNADPKTFQSLGDYSKDAKNVYFKGILIDGLIAQEFRYADPSNNFIADNNNLYLNGKKIDGVNIKDVRFFEDKQKKQSVTLLYFIFKNNVYYENKIIEKADVNSFEIINYSERYWKEDYYAKDKNYVYYKGNIVIGANPKTFKYVPAIFGEPIDGEARIIEGSKWFDGICEYKEGVKYKCI